MNTVILLSPRRERTSLAKTIIVTSLSILWDVLGVYESYILDEPPFLYFKWLLPSIYWKFIFEEKMINFPTLMNTIMEWRGSNCFGHHYFMYFKTKQTKPGSLLRPLLWQPDWPYLGPCNLDETTKTVIDSLFSWHSAYSTPRFFLNLCLF